MPIAARDPAVTEPRERHPRLRRLRWTLVLALAAALTPACSYAQVTPGFRGLYVDADARVDRIVLAPGRHKLGTMCFLHRCRHIDTFDVTYTVHREPPFAVTSRDGLAVDLDVELVHRPIILELVELRAALGSASYEKYVADVVDPELQLATITVLAQHPLSDVTTSKELIEDEIEKDVRQRVAGKHVEISTITISSPARPEP
jgi:hypothetical protein